MRIVIIHARYVDQVPLQNFLAQLFGVGRCEVTWSRGQYQCLMPRGLKKNELDYLCRTVAVEHYQAQ